VRARLWSIRSLRGPLTILVVALVLVVALLVLWNVVLAIDYQRLRELAHRAAEEEGSAFHTTFIALGSVLFVATISLLSILGSQLIQEIRYTQRLTGFFQAFTHELNSPLASIKLMAQTLRGQELERVQANRFLDAILGDVERLYRQIANVLTTAQIEGPVGLRAQVEPVELGGFLEEYARTLRLGFERHARGPRLELDLAARPVWVGLDRGAFRHVLDNLVDNAVKHGRATGTTIRLSLEPGSSGGWVEIVVTDDGPGIHPADLQTIFEPFHRARRRGRAAPRGSGLGLWIVRALVHAHGGRVTATTVGEEGGARFCISLRRRRRAGAPHNDVAALEPGEDPAVDPDVDPEECSP